MNSSGGNTNAHLAECDSTNDYSWSVCCAMSGDDEIISGCTNSEASNYNPEATTDDGSCTDVGPPTEECNFWDGLLIDGEECDLLDNVCMNDGLICQANADNCGECVGGYDGGGGGWTSSNCLGQFGILGDCEVCSPGDDCEYGGQRTQTFYTFAEWGVDDPNSDCYELSEKLDYGEGDPEVYCENYFEISDQDCYINLEEEVPFYDWFSLIFTLITLTSYYIVNRKQKVL